MGPILPQINVFGKELGISPDVMGFITSLLPILYVLAKPAVGYLIDAFPVSYLSSNLHSNFYSHLINIFTNDFFDLKIHPGPFLSHSTEYSEDNIHINYFNDGHLLRRFLLCAKCSIAKYTKVAFLQFHRNR